MMNSRTEEVGEQEETHVKQSDPPVEYPNKLIMASLAELLRSRKCVQCEKLSEKVFMAPYCSHVLCARCLAHSAPSKCPTCQKEFVLELMTPDLVFEVLWNQFNGNQHVPQPETPQTVMPSVSSEAEVTPTNQKSPFLKRNTKGETVLHQLCSLAFRKKSGFSSEKLKAMLASGANPNTYDAGGITPIHEAILYDHLSILKLLLEAGGRVNSYRVPPCTPLHVAVERYLTADLTEGSVAYRIITTLLDYGANVHAKDCHRRTPILDKIPSSLSFRQRCCVSGLSNLATIANRTLPKRQSSNVAGNVQIGAIVRDIAKDNPKMLALLSSYMPLKIDRVELLVPEMPMVVFSCILDKSGLAAMKKFTQKFKIKCKSPKSGLSPDVTHVIVPEQPKSSSFIIRRAILSGIYVVTMDWVTDSLTKGCILPAEDYEISGPLVSQSKLGYPSRRARMAKMIMMPKLFAGGQFHVLSNSSQEIDKREKLDLAQLIETGGGTILSREPKHADTGECDPSLFHAPEGSMFEKCSVFVLFKTFPTNFPTMTFNMPHMKHVPIQWFYDCVDTYSILEW